jgi:RNA polymerase sigma factor (TIGR02999 family)
VDGGGGEITGLLQRWASGDRQALAQLAPLVYDELRRLAQSYLRGQGDGHTLPATALVHELYLQLCHRAEPRLENRAHFFAVAAKMMRHILVDHARRRGALKRGRSAGLEPLDNALTVPVQANLDLLSLNESLTELAAVDLRKSRVVEMRFFGGMSEKEIATVTGTSEATVRRDWTIARAWLYRRMEGTGAV